MENVAIPTPRKSRLSRVLFPLVTFAVLLVLASTVSAGTTIVAIKTAAVVPGATTDLDGDGKADPGDTLEYTVTINNVSGVSQSGVSFDDNPDPNTTYVANSLNASPLAVNDTYGTIGNTLLDVGTSAADPAVHVSGSLFTNDVEFLGASFGTSGTHITAHTNPSNGVLASFNNDTGTFTYLPTAGYAGTDTFTYTLTDAGGLTDTATVTINVNSQRVWYVKNDAPANGLGRSSDPFDTLVEAQTASTSNDTIYLFLGDGTVTNQNAGITLKTGQRLLGEFVALTVPVSVNGGPNPTVLRAAGSTRPKIGNAAASSNGVSLSTGSFGAAEVRGLDLSGTSNAIDVTTSTALSGSLELADDVISAAGAEGIDINLNAGSTGTLTVHIHNNTFSATGSGLDITRSAGSLAASIHDNTVSSAASGIVISGGAVANTTITAFDDNVVSGNATATGINISNVTFDADTVTGGIQQVSGGTTPVGQSGNGVGGSGVLLTTVQGNLFFTDLDIVADGGAGLRATGTGSGFTLGVTADVATISATGGPSVDVTSVAMSLPFSDVDSTNSTTTGIALNSVTGTFSAGAGSTITGVTSSGTAFQVGSSNATISYAGSINTTAGKGVDLTSNTGSTITFNGGMSLSTGANAAFSATGGGTVNVCDESPCNAGATGALVNTLTTTTGTALNVANTTIGSNNLEFRSVSSNGAASGIVLNNTGASGSLVVKGNGGSCTSAANCTGGAIQNSTSYGISLNTTLSPSFTRIGIQSAGRSGIDGQQVTNFTLANSLIDNVGTAAAGQYEESGIAFEDKGPSFNTAPVSGTVTITANTISNARRHGIAIETWNGTISNLTISSNTLTSSTSEAVSLGNAIHVFAQGSASTTAHITTGTIANNTITNFPSGSGIIVAGGSGNASNNTSTTLGAAGTPIAITGNSITGNVGKIYGNAIQVAFNGNSGNSNFNISNNGTVAAPLTNFGGLGISVFFGGSMTASATVNNNVISSHNTAGSSGIGVQLDEGPTADNNDTGVATVTVTNNTVTNNDGNGIRGIVRASNGTLNLKVQNNTVSAPLTGVRNGIRVDSGSSAGNTSLCLNISGNTSAGSGGTQGIGLRKQGTVSTTNAFAINGMAATSSPGVETYVTGLNPAGNGTMLISATSGFTNCSLVMATPEQKYASVESGSEPASSAESLVAIADPINTLTESVGLIQQTSYHANQDPLAAAVPAPIERVRDNSQASATDALAPAQTPGIVHLDIGTLPAGKSITLKFRVTINSVVSLPAGTTQVSNQGTVTYGAGATELTDDPAVGGANDPTVTQLHLPDLTITKTHSGNFQQGQTGATYTLTVTNSGAEKTNGSSVTVSDTLPTGLTASAISGTGWTCVLGTLTCTRTDVLNASASYPAITLTVNVAGTAPASVTNTATVSGGGETVTANDAVNDPTTIDPVADLQVVKSDSPDPVHAGNNLTYTVSFTNNGPGTGSTVAVTDPVPANTTFVSASITSGTGWTATTPAVGGTGNVVFSKPSVTPSETAVFQIVVKVNPGASNGSTISNTATASSPTSDPTPGNNSSTATTTVDTQADLAVTKTDGVTTAVPGGSVTYTITASNAGPSNASGATVADTFPASLTATWTCVGAGGGTCTASGSGNINDTVNLPAGGSVTYTASATISAAATGTLANTATVSAPAGTTDPTPGNNSATDTDTLTPQADLQVTKTAPATVDAGANFDYSITVTNNGPSDAQSVALTDSLPTGTTFVSQSQSSGPSFTLTHTGNNVGDTITTLAAGASAVIKITVLVDADAANNSTLSNTANVASPTDSTLNNNSSTATSSVRAGPDMTITKAHSGTFRQGDTGKTYTITVTNSGAQSSTGAVTVLDTLPTGLMATALGGTGWSCTLATLTCTRSDALAAGSSYETITLTVDVAANAPASVTNTATVSGGGEVITTNDTANDPTTVVLVADLTVAKSHISDFTQTQTAAQYSLTVTNLGSGPTLGTVTVVDTLPTGLTATAISGTGWTCTLATLTCTRSDALAAGGSYVPITLSVDVAGNAPSIVTNQVAVSGGGELNTGNDSAIDPTVVHAPPDTTINLGPADPTNSSSATFTFSGSGGTPPLLFECSLDGAPFAACTSPHNYPALADGSHVFQVRAVDANAVRDATPASTTWTIDTVAPDTTIDTQPTNPTATNSAAFTFSGTDNVGGVGVESFECQLDGGGFGACTSPQNYTGLSDGSHTFQVRAVDKAKNTDPTPASYTWVVDTTAPDTTITANPPAATNSTSASFSFTGSDGNGTGVAGFECSLDGAGFAACTSPQNYTGLGEGSHIFEVRAVDIVGNKDATPASYTWVIDLTAPDTTITAQPPNPSNSANASFSFSGSDNLTPTGALTFECSLDAAPFSACTSPQSYTGLTDGSHTFQVRGVDAVGNPDATPASYTWVIDTVAPDTTINTMPANPTASNTAAFTFSGTDNVGGVGIAGFECQIDGGGFVTCTSPQSYSGLSDGSHTFEVRAKDQANNTDPSPASYTWVVDTLAPDTTITANPAANTNSTSASFSFTGSDGSGTGVAGFECSLDSASFAGCTSPQNYTGLVEGSHNFQVRAVDAVGNKDATPASYTWLVDLTSPDTTIDTQPTNPSNNPNASFTFSGTDNAGGSGVASFECQLDGGGFGACASPKDYTGLSDGSHTFQVRSIDNAGNVDASPASYTWVVDSTPPDTTITGNPPNPYANNAATFTFTGNDGAGTGVARYECSLDSAVFATCTSPQNYTGLSLGSHTFQVRAIDQAGNSDPTPASYTWQVTFTPITISGTKFNDLNGDAAQGTGENGLAGWTIELRDATDDHVITTALTLADGSYSFPNLSFGTYRVREVQQIGWLQTTPDPADITAVSGVDVPNVDFGNVQPANLGITKTAATTAAAGTMLTYSLVATNQGPIAAQSVVLTDPLPAHTTFKSLSIPAGWNCTKPLVGATGAVTCKRASWDSGSTGTFTLIVKVDAATPENTLLSNTATLSSDTFDNDTSDNSATAITTAVGSADVSIRKTGIVLGNGLSIRYTLTIKNNGPSYARSVTVQDPLDSATQFIKAATARGKCTGGTTVNCNVGDLKPGKTVRIIITVKLLHALPFVTNTATVTSTTADPATKNNSATIKVPLGSANLWNGLHLRLNEPAEGLALFFKRLVS